MRVLDLTGCAPQPLGHYLKALGVLRIVGEQADRTARGWWDGERFRLATAMDRDELVDFFLTRFEPTPFVAPWLRGSGFFQANDRGVTPLERSVAPRLQAFRDGIAAARAMLPELTTADQEVRRIKDETKDKTISKASRTALRESDEYKKRLAAAEHRFKELKDGLIPTIRSLWRGPHRDWIDAALVLDDANAPRYPALLGSGGNDGRLDFTNNFMQRLGDLFDLGSSQAVPRANASSWLVAALWGAPSPGYARDVAIGQFIPGAAGGANSTNGPSGDSLLNPFDYVLMMEGCVVMRASATRRLDANASQRAAAPFVVPAFAAGYASAARSDESARGEQWMPLWSQPMLIAEVKHLFAEGRAQLGRSSASRPLDFACAATRMGVARGIASFQRFGYIERNGQSNLAVPLGRFQVRDRASENDACLDDVAAWTARIHREASGADAPARLATAARRVGDACFEATRRPDSPLTWQELLRAMVGVEAVMRTGTGFRAGPIPLLSAGWLLAADDGSSEFRLALSFALQVSAGNNSRAEQVDGVRRHWLPLVAARVPRFAVSGDTQHPRLDMRPEVVLDGRDGIGDAIALVTRRLFEASQKGQRAFPLVPAPGAATSPADVMDWISGEVDANRTLELGRALMAIDRRAMSRARDANARPTRSTVAIDDGWACIRLACLPWPIGTQTEAVCEPAILRRLAAGDASGALDLAVRRLRAAGLTPPVRSTAAAYRDARRWAASLAFPISQPGAELLLRALDLSTPKEFSQ